MSDVSSDRAGRSRRPRVSGKVAVLWLVLGLALAALVVPMALHLPVWIDAEVVLAIWWAVWLFALARLLYTGSLITDDHEWRAPRSWISSDKAKSGVDWADGCIYLPMESEGCLIIVGLIALVFGAWFLIEIAVPGLMLLVYAIARGMLAHVVNDTHHCRGRFGRSVSWALVWATLYTAPYAAGVWFVHLMHAKQ